MTETTNTAPVAAANTSMITLPSGLKVRKVANVTLPQLKLLDDVGYYLRFDTKIDLAQDQVSDKPKREKKDAAGNVIPRAAPKYAPPELAQVTNLATGEQVTIIVNAVLSDLLRDKYPNDGYIGKAFAIMRYRVQGKDYVLFNVAEIEIEAPPAVPAADASAADAPDADAPAASRRRA